MQSGREDTLEERYAIKFCFKLGKTATETYGMLQTAYGPSCMNLLCLHLNKKKLVNHLIRSIVNNILKYLEFTAIINACTKKVWKLIECTSYE